MLELVIRKPNSAVSGTAEITERRANYFVQPDTTPEQIMDVLAHEVGHLFEAALRRSFGLDPFINETHEELDRVAELFGIPEFSDLRLSGWIGGSDDPLTRLFAEISGKLFWKHAKVDDSLVLGLPSDLDQQRFLEWLAFVLGLPRYHADCLADTRPLLELGPLFDKDTQRRFYHQQVRPWMEHKGYKVVGPAVSLPVQPGLGLTPN